MVNDWHVNFNDTVINECDLKKNENIGLLFVFLILFAASAASLLFFAMVIVEARRAKKSLEHRYESGMYHIDEAELGKMWARKKSSLENGRRETLKLSSNPRLPSIKEREDKSLSDLYSVLPPTIEVEEAESLDTFSAGDTDTMMMRGRYTRGLSNVSRLSVNPAHGHGGHMSLSRTKSQRVVDKILHSMATGMPLTEDTKETDANQRTSERKPPSPKVTLNLGMPRLLRSSSVDHSLDSGAVENFGDKRRGTLGKGARQLASLFSVDENALSTANKENADEESGPGEVEQEHEDHSRPTRVGAKRIRRKTTGPTKRSSAFLRRMGQGPKTSLHKERPSSFQGGDRRRMTFSDFAHLQLHRN